MARPQIHDDALRARLLEVTATMVDDKGPERISLREVAQAAGTSTTAVYSLFGGKAQLLVAVIEHGFASFGRAQSECEAEGLRALGFAYRAWAKANPALYRLMFGGAITAVEGCAPDDAITSAAMMPLMRALSARVPDGEVPTAAITVWAQVHGAVGLELAAVTPEIPDWDAQYRAVVDAVERAFPAPPTP